PSTRLTAIMTNGCMVLLIAAPPVWWFGPVLPQRDPSKFTKGNDHTIGRFVASPIEGMALSSALPERQRFASGFMESRLALLSPRLVSFRYLPGPQAGILCHDQLIGQHPGIVLKRLVEQPFGLSCGGWGTSTTLLDDLAQPFLALRRRAGIVDQSHRARFSRCNPFVQQRKVLGAAQPDDPRQPQYCSIRNQAVSRCPKLDY